MLAPASGALTTSGISPSRNADVRMTILRTGRSQERVESGAGQAGGVDTLYMLPTRAGRAVSKEYDAGKSALDALIEWADTHVRDPERNEATTSSCSAGAIAAGEADVAVIGVSS
jgi:hypothetical protein